MVSGKIQTSNAHVSDFFFLLMRSLLERLPEMELWAVLAWAIWNARNKICLWGQSSSTWSLQKRLLFAMKLFRRLQKTIGKTSFFNSKSLSSTITHQILKHLWGKMSLSKIPIIFVKNMICFGGKCSRLTFYSSIKMFTTNKVLFTMTEEKPLELLALVTVYVHQKYKIFFLWW